MLINQLIKFLEEASAYPALFWDYNYFLARNDFIREFEAIAAKIKPETNVRKFLDDLLRVLKDEGLDEYRLAQALYNLSRVFPRTSTSENEVNRFVELSLAFFDRAKLYKVHEDTRNQMKKDLSPDKLHEFEKKLFETEGVWYCLEYYLSVYKILSDLKSEKEKMDFFAAKEINLGFGKLVGPKEDFREEDFLKKFALFILEDEVREDVLKAYYHIKEIIYTSKDSNLLETKYKEYIINLLKIFLNKGTEKLTGNLLKDYESRTKLKDILEVLK